MNNTIQTNQCYQKFIEIFSAIRIINRWLSAGPVLLHQPLRQCLTWWLLFVDKQSWCTNSMPNSCKLNKLLPGPPIVVQENSGSIPNWYLRFAQPLRFAILLASVPVPSPDKWGGLSVRKGSRDIKAQRTKTDDTEQQRNGAQSLAALWWAEGAKNPQVG